MEAKSYSLARKELSMTMEKVCEDHSPIIITRKNAKPVVMISLEDFNSMEETAYLMKSRANAERLNESIKQAEDGKLITHDIIEDRVRKKKRDEEFS